MAEENIENITRSDSLFDDHLLNNLLIRKVLLIIIYYLA